MLNVYSDQFYFPYS